MTQQRPDVDDIIAVVSFVTAWGVELKTARTASSNTAGTLFWLMAEHSTYLNAAPTLRVRRSRVQGDAREGRVCTSDLPREEMALVTGNGGLFLLIQSAEL